MPRNQRLAAELYETAGWARFLTVRAAPGRAPFGERRYAEIAVCCLLEQQAKSQCRLEVYCVLPDHLHAIVTPVADGASSLQYMDRFKGWCSRELHLVGWDGPVWQPRSYDHLVRKDEDREALYGYILQNPVRLGLCIHADDWPWSGAPGLL